jgi:hypothetical protein
LSVPPQQEEALRSRKLSYFEQHFADLQERLLPLILTAAGGGVGVGAAWRCWVLVEIISLMPKGIGDGSARSDEQRQ